MPNLLFEVGMEEIPARMITAAQTELRDRVVELLRRERLLATEHEVRSYSTARRLAVQVNGVLGQQPDATQEMTGPAWGVAFKDGQPTAAAQAFARKAGVEVGALKKVTTAKGDYVGATAVHKGREATEILGALLATELAALYWPKNMYWRPQKPERFVRPVRWMVALLGQVVLPVEFGGVRAGTQTYGHRILYGNVPVAVHRPEDYLKALEAANVIADVEFRRHRIRKALDKARERIPGARWREDEALIDTVTHLTEWPAVVLGVFDGEFLELPDEVLVTVMRDHQKYFAVETAERKLAPFFLAVLNTEPDENGAAVIRHGNERVLRARFNDARFFWDVDQKTTLEDRVEKLKSVTFHKELGNYWDKTQANLETAQRIAAVLRERGTALDEAAVRQATTLAKTDLTTELVKEFTELQGVIGGLYARAQGLGEAVAQAIYWQYSPAAMEDAIPPTIEGQVLGIADRIQTIVAMFGIGLEPTGSKDPYALRRAANAIVKILAETGLPLSISDLLASAPGETSAATSEKLTAFFRERLEFWLREVRGFAYDVVNAVLAADSNDVRDAIARAEALTAVRGSEDLAAIAAAFKRIKNLLRQAVEKGVLPKDGAAGPVRQTMLTDDGERALFAAAANLAPEVETLRGRREYQPALEKIATLRPQVDLFFDKVMVMVEDEPLRRNRLALIAIVLGGFSSIADFSELVSA